MSSSSTNNFPALEMAHCPNCGFVIEQLGARTSCNKCGKKITILCLTCQTNNPPVFHLCMNCGTDFRLIGVEHFHKQLAKLEFDLAEHARNTVRQKNAQALFQLLKIAATIAPFLLAFIAWLFFSLTFALLAITVLLICKTILIKFFLTSWSRKLVGIPAEIADDWPRLCRTAEKQQLQKQEAESELAFYQQELNRFRKKG